MRGIARPFTLHPVNRLATRWTATTILALSSATALAGDTGTSTSDTTGAVDSTTSATTGEGSSSATTGGDCDVCPPGTSTGTVEFSDLDHGRPPAGERVVEVTAASICTCTDCMCGDEQASQITLALDGAAVGQPCAAAQCEFTVVFTPGSHELTATATYPSGDVSGSVEVLVESEGGSSETGVPMADGDDASGCGCTTRRREVTPFALLALVAALARRRRVTSRSRA